MQQSFGPTTPAGLGHRVAVVLVSLAVLLPGCGERRVGAASELAVIAERLDRFLMTAPAYSDRSEAGEAARLRVGDLMEEAVAAARRAGDQAEGASEEDLEALGRVMAAVEGWGGPEFVKALGSGR